MRISRRQASMALVVFGVIVGCTSEREAPREHVTSTREALSIAVPFTFPLGQSLFTTPPYAKSGLQIGAGTTVEARRGQIANASSTFVLGANAQIGDASLGNEVSVIAGGSAVLGANSRITGFLQPTQQVQQGANSLVALGVRSPQPFPSLRTFNIEATFPTPTAAIIVGANQQTTIPPGTSYTALTLGAGATAHLSAGRYYFGSVTIGSQATLDIDDTQGEVIIFAAGAWTSAGKSIFRKGPEGLAVVRLGNGGTTITQRNYCCTVG